MPKKNEYSVFLEISLTIQATSKKEVERILKSGIILDDYEINDSEIVKIEYSPERNSLENNYRTCSFNTEISNIIFKTLPIKKCPKCNGELNHNEARFYQANLKDKGFYLDNLKEKVWIFFTCKKCNHQHGINRLGVKNNKVFKIPKKFKEIEDFILDF